MNRRPLGQVVLAISGLGVPLTQVAIRRFGRPGAMVVETVSVGLLARDVVLLAGGATSRLRRGPAILLWLEAGAAALAAAAGLRPLVDPEARARAAAARPDPPEALRRLALGLLFGLHTARFRIYLRPDHGLRAAGGDQ